MVSQKAQHFSILHSAYEYATGCYIFYRWSKMKC